MAQDDHIEGPAVRVLRGLDDKDLQATVVEFETIMERMAVDTEPRLILFRLAEAGRDELRIRREDCGGCWRERNEGGYVPGSAHLCGKGKR